MDILNVLPYGGIALLVVLLAVFEIQNRQGGGYANNNGYVYYTHKSVAVKIKRVFASRYKIYVNAYDVCPVATRKDRYGTYFLLKARSASDAEYQIEEIYKVI